MPPKKANAFMEFVHEWRLTNPKGLGMSLPEAVDRSGEIWKEEHTRYVEKAKSINLQIRGHPDHPLVRMDLARREVEDRQKEMRSSTERMVLEALKKLCVAKC